MPKQINPQIIRRLKMTSRVLSAAVSLVGFSALIGWQFDIVYLKRIIPSLPVIAPNTAIAFLLGGALLFFADSFKTIKKKYLGFVSYFFVLAILLLGFLTLVEYIFKLNFGIDGIFFSKAQGSFPVRMSPQSAFNFLKACNIFYLNPCKFFFFD